VPPSYMKGTIANHFKSFPLNQKYQVSRGCEFKPHDNLKHILFICLSQWILFVLEAFPHGVGGSVTHEEGQMLGLTDYIVSHKPST